MHVDDCTLAWHIWHGPKARPQQEGKRTSQGKPPCSHPQANELHRARCLHEVLGLGALHLHHFRRLQQGLERAVVQHRRPTSFLLPRPIHVHSSMALPLPMERPHLNRPQPLPSVLPPLLGPRNLRWEGRVGTVAVFPSGH